MIFSVQYVLFDIETMVKYLSRVLPLDSDKYKFDIASHRKPDKLDDTRGYIIESFGFCRIHPVDIL